MQSLATGERLSGLPRAAMGTTRLRFLPVSSSSMRNNKIQNSKLYGITRIRTMKMSKIRKI